MCVLLSFPHLDAMVQPLASCQTCHFSGICSWSGQFTSGHVWPTLRGINDRHVIACQLLQLSDVNCHDCRKEWFGIMKCQRCMGPSNVIILYVRKLSAEINRFVQGHTGTLSGLCGAVISLSSTCSLHSTARMIHCQPSFVTLLPCLQTFCSPLLFLVSELGGGSSWQKPSALSATRRLQ